ncbi:hypothetical protein IVB14_24720 [Bradyrhizobium sp. 180]|uniref:hypothetical protein n=1 Tax=unclassified Bradyrhizobium TaxID=2631580 RepID=UPI001FF7BCD0|nr:MULTISPECIES: hypothetical protein [unclassified Bradyrhizobium]MCK1420887.1 hypothetical protein [Bradyrhizobium sp. CW12]MCK1493530.1 hypothetical protein [Bradyrhizobium sp. 180]MCK1526264.1 hypothetical protein [Bradyrhizobium sp. 182]MCK1595928.1 hypothetical protein [Bradyrhizobium sp. 164]MCK1647137.1 hypothetical protein [Bradyrhizobium sp. 154]
MVKLIVAVAFIMSVTAAQAQQGTAPKAAPNQAKLEKCRQLAKERGFGSGMENAKGGNNMRSFVVACMQGKQS